MSGPPTYFGSWLRPKAGGEVFGVWVFFFCVKSLRRPGKPKARPRGPFLLGGGGTATPLYCLLSFCWGVRGGYTDPCKIRKVPLGPLEAVKMEVDGLGVRRRCCKPAYNGWKTGDWRSTEAYTSPLADSFVGVGLF